MKNENNHIASSKDYTVYHSINDNKKYVISLNNISLSDKPIREVHGGATIEECFVPCIVFSNKNEVQNYNSVNLKFHISPNQILQLCRHIRHRYNDNHHTP